MALSDPAPLRGLIVRADADRLIVQASEHDIARFDPKPRQQLEMRRRDVTGKLFTGGARNDVVRTITRAQQLASGITPGRLDFRSGEGLLYDVDGRPVAYIESLSQNVDMVRAWVEIKAIGVPGVEVV